MMGTALQRSKCTLVDLLCKVRTYIHMVFNFVFKGTELTNDLCKDSFSLVYHAQ